MNRPYFHNPGLYFFSYTLLFIVLYIVLVSLFSFVNFFLDQNLADIENWLSHNTWVLIVSSKLISLLLFSHLFKINLRVLGILDYLKQNFRRPKMKTVLSSLFILFVFYFVTKGNIEQNKLAGLYKVSPLGTYFSTILYVLLDVLFLRYILQQREGKGFKRNAFIFVTSLILFIFSSKALVIDFDLFFVFSIMHFIFLTAILCSRESSYIDLLTYSLIVIGPISLIFGIDFLNSSSFSFYTITSDQVLKTCLLIWPGSLLYYIARN